MLFEILIVLALIVVNGVLSMSEMAIVSARPARLRSLEGKSRGAGAALRLAEQPGRFLSTVQIGITMVGVLSGAFSGATLGARLSDWLAAEGMARETANTLGVGGVVLVLTYLSLIVGELVPKQLALKNAEGIAIRMAPAMLILSRAAAPVVWVLEHSGRLVLFLMGQSGESTAKVTEEEVHTLLSEAHEEGLIEPEEREMMAGVMRLADRSARALMTPRHEVEMLELEASSVETVAAIRRIARPRMPVQSRESGEVVGIVRLSDAFNALSRRETLDPKKLLREVPVVSDMADALDVMEILQGSDDHLALVYDEYGHFEGIITSGDILEAITGSVAAATAEEPALVERADGSLLVSGWMPADEFCDRMGLPRELAGGYETVAGLVLNIFGRLPALGEAVEAEGLRFEIMDFDDRRIDKVLVSKTAD
ncbi:hemolysin family protein [Paragemmobacter straminiformis]|uniref:HlyC/CorC family transporter n=1 Tax=Paragemmobacter straminiformis TaxID=2045119 RepID=A0A842IAV9_9RHOB|nr:hemolysin family protein [Gemmobacter straminiformis]MBC2836805.1 HlyC/CorC family transporter [Gemmobacter straminiformis]